MNCKDWEELIPSSLIGELDEELNSKLETHLKTCDECNQVLIQTKELLGMIDNGAETVPPSKMRDQFLDNLADEKLRLSKPSSTMNFSFYRIAASIALLIVGFGAGKLTSSNEVDPGELAALRSDIHYMKELVMVSMLSEESASERIRAVASIEEFNNPSSEVIETLLATLNSDQSPNVRLAAIKALSRFSSREEVKLSLIRSFEFQDDPVIQISMINAMVDIGEKRAVKKFRELINNESTQQIVKDQAGIGIQLLSI